MIHAERYIVAILVGNLNGHLHRRTWVYDRGLHLEVLQVNIRTTPCGLLDRELVGQIGVTDIGFEAVRRNACANQLAHVATRVHAAIMHRNGLIIGQGDSGREFVVAALGHGVAIDLEVVSRRRYLVISTISKNSHALPRGGLARVLETNIFGRSHQQIAIAVAAAIEVPVVGVFLFVHRNLLDQYLRRSRRFAIAVEIGLLRRRAIASEGGSAFALHEVPSMGGIIGCLIVIGDSRPNSRNRTGYTLQHISEDRSPCAVIVRASHI